MSQSNQKSMTTLYYFIDKKNNPAGFSLTLETSYGGSFNEQVKKYDTVLNLEVGKKIFIVFNKQTNEIQDVTCTEKEVEKYEKEEKEGKYYIFSTNVQKYIYSF